MAATVVEQKIHRLSDLLLIRHLLADRGVTSDQLPRFEAEIAKARERLVELRVGPSRRWSCDNNYLILMCSSIPARSLRKL